MSAESDTQTTVGVESSIGWPVGGAVGGAVGALVFGALIWLFDPEVVSAAIPGIYGLDPTGVVGWGIHLAHGIVLGLIFGFLVTREPILGTLQMNPETESLSRTGITLRVVAAGFVFGLAVWALLPLLVLPVWLEAIGTEAAADFPTTAVESLIGHLLFGTVLGIAFALVTNLQPGAAETPLEG
ncbi:uncharacterized protein Nmag_3229 [Natrialba magadii ATCC 43099]|uniref:Histidine kinase n=1 Tax=Natrialba magadii (strain ATCC 43099 / DSM 3394 / CCM 3739 / CIP 104546 / IAM 13178 / JCM 8861 / NBRC 102185 / NCIMB 2190 / MS3) TaxID=547559 RepID=D3SS05_NATMM|nr:hypothetical protein [Natrialba magadii]ADD06779.1 uncharacterized protein Nmag_3229 [Natrialba magadii ATCC 43099]ELY27785.1 hypothetical protein C500_14091 [Natrialba magadii ATCC 43099]